MKEKNIKSKKVNRKPVVKKKEKLSISSGLNAMEFTKKLMKFQSPIEAKIILRYFKTGKGEYEVGDKFIGVRMGQVFEVAKEFMEMPLKEIEKLLESPIHEVRTGGLSIMDFQARKKEFLNQKERTEKSQKIFRYVCCNYAPNYVKIRN